MNGQIESARAHPAAVISFAIAGLAVAACALVAIAYMLGWVGSKPPPSPTSMATPGLQVAGSAPDLALSPGETLVAPAEAPAAPLPPAPLPAAPSAASPKAPASTPAPAAPAPAKPAPAQRKAAAPIYAPAPPAPSSSTSYAQVLPPRAAPSRPNYTRSELAASNSHERATRSFCVNCGTVASIGAYGPDWEVRVRFEDGSSETLRFPERPRFRVGDRVHLEDGQILPD